MMKKSALHSLAVLIILLSIRLVPTNASQEPQIKTGTSQGVRARLAVADFQSNAGNSQLSDLTKIFNQVLWNDLDMAGVFELVPKSFYPLKLPSKPTEVINEQWTSNEVKAHDLVYGNTALDGGEFSAECRLLDLNTNESILGLRYRVTPDERGVRSAAHKFADEIVSRLGGGIPGIASTQIAFVSDRTSHKEIWVMDYDGFGQHAITNHRSITLTPRWSRDNSKIAYTSYRRGNPDLYIQSLADNRLLSFPSFGGLTTTPAWSLDGERLAFTSSQTQDPEIYVSDIRGRNLKRLTNSRGVDISPVWNPKTGYEIAFVSDRSGSPQIYIMDAEGANVRRLTTEGGEAVSPSWSPDGDKLAFAWRKVLTGNFDIFLIDIVTGRYIQLTRDSGTNEQPVWSPDSRHIAFESTRNGGRQIFIMLANGTRQKAITTVGKNTAPSWSNFSQK
ncbi:MAG: Tol-Pal system beta propeller repeat protein TolB [Terriglobia bacterium]